MTHTSRTLRIGSFGALRLLKNHTTAAAAALMLARKRGCDLEFSVSVESDTMGGAAVLDALRKMFADLKWAKLVERPWEDWATFRQTVSGMDLCLQVSMTETFNITMADAVAEGVPCVVSPSIEWAPDYWKADTDRLEDVVRIGAVAARELRRRRGRPDRPQRLRRRRHRSLDRLPHGTARAARRGGLSDWRAAAAFRLAYRDHESVYAARDRGARTTPTTEIGYKGQGAD